MFYERFLQLCGDKKVSPSAAATKSGFNRGTVSVWKKKYELGQDVVPDQEIIKKICTFFGCTESWLRGIEDEKKPLVNNDEELTEYLEELRTRPEMRMLFSVSKDATKADVEKAVAIIEALRKAEGKG